MDPHIWRILNQRTIRVSDGSSNEIPIQCVRTGLAIHRQGIRLSARALIGPISPVQRRHHSPFRMRATEFFDLSPFPIQLRAIPSPLSSFAPFLSLSLIIFSFDRKVENFFFPFISSPYSIIYRWTTLFVGHGSGRRRSGATDSQRCSKRINDTRARSFVPAARFLR